MPGFFVTIQNDISRLCETVGSANSYEYMKIIEKFIYRRYHAKQRNYYLITVKGDKRVDLKEFRKNNNTRALSFASADDLMNLMGLIPGAVTPLGLLNDSECKVTLFLDNDFMNDADLIGVHPNDNTATVWLKAKDLMNLIQKHGNTVNIVQI